MSDAPQCEALPLLADGVERGDLGVRLRGQPLAPAFRGSSRFDRPARVEPAR
jgi:hypothetical protein